MLHKQVLINLIFVFANKYFDNHFITSLSLNCCTINGILNWRVVNPPTFFFYKIYNLPSWNK